MQKEVLAALRRHGFWHALPTRCRWVWNSRGGTYHFMRRFVVLGLAVQDGDGYFKPRFSEPT